MRLSGPVRTGGDLLVPRRGIIEALRAAGERSRKQPARSD
jgi:hypothetical protein